MVSRTMGFSAHRGRTEAPGEHQAAGSRAASPSGGNISGEIGPATSAPAKGPPGPPASGGEAEGGPALARPPQSPQDPGKWLKDKGGL